MRSTRQKLKLLRGISRANANGGSSLTSRKSSNSNYQGVSLTSAIQTGLNGGGQHLNNHHQHHHHHPKHNHHSNALSQHNNQLHASTNQSTSVSTAGGRPKIHQKSNNNNSSSSSNNNHNNNNHVPTAATRAGALRIHSSASSSFSKKVSSPTSTSTVTTAAAAAASASEAGIITVNRKDCVAETNSIRTTHALEQELEKGTTCNRNTNNNNNNTIITTSPPRNISNGHPHRQWTQFLTSNMDCTGLNSDIREKAFGICRDYLHGAWKQIDSKDLVIKRVSGGLSNWLYHCSLPLSLTPQHNEPAQVLLRFYGQVHGEDALESLITESVIFTLLSERKLGPRLYGVFPGGRVEEFIPARPLQTEELRDTELSLLIAQKTAQIHGLNIPISKEPSWLWGTMDRWMTNVRECFMQTPSMNECKPEILQKLIDANLEKELEWLQNFLPTSNSPVVFAHNDLQEGNILIRPDYETPDEKLALIDFEYCSYNYRGFDLANHFCEWSYNYNVETYPNFKFTPGDLPSDEEKLRFIRRYIAILREEYRMNFADADEEFLNTSPLFNEDHIMREVEIFTLASHFFWSLWAIVNAQVSKIPFGYWEYGLCRLQSYFELKKTLNV